MTYGETHQVVYSLISSIAFTLATLHAHWPHGRKKVNAYQVSIQTRSFVYTYFFILPFRYKTHWIYYLPDNEDKHVQKDKYANLSEKKRIFYLKKKNQLSKNNCKVCRKIYGQEFHMQPPKKSF